MLLPAAFTVPWTTRQRVSTVANLSCVFGKKSAKSSGCNKTEMKKTVWRQAYTRLGLLVAGNQDIKGKNWGERWGGGRDWLCTVTNKRKAEKLMILSC